MGNFSEMELPPSLLKSLSDLQFDTPTPIQEETIPLALQGFDVLGSAQTGTGKTLAFGLPLLAKMIEDPEAHALVLAPTRELAQQVFESLKKMVRYESSLQLALLIGGESMFKQFHRLRQNPRIIVGTPGRVIDHLERRSWKGGQVKFLVLDETDRMLDMGFGVQIEHIVSCLAEERQTLMFSATLPPNIMKLTKTYLKDPKRVSVGSTTAPAANIKQEIVYVSEAEKYEHLINQLNEREGSVIVFVKTKIGAERLADKLRQEEHQALAIHGDLKQQRREKVIQAFRRGRSRIMVATDVAARGLDIPHIQHVINYDLPQAPEDYIHRIGRTARAGAEGSALCLIAPQDTAKWKAIHRLMHPEEAREPRRREFPSKGGPRGPFRSSFGKGKPFSPRQGRPFDDRPREERSREDRPRSSGPRASGEEFFPKSKPRAYATGGERERFGNRERSGENRFFDRQRAPRTGERKSFRPRRDD